MIYSSMINNLEKKKKNYIKQTIWLVKATIIFK